MQTSGGLLTVDDLTSYRVQTREPHQVDYRGATLTTNPPPSFGGSIVCAALRELDGDERDYAETPDPRRSTAPRDRGAEDPAHSRELVQGHDACQRDRRRRNGRLDDDVQRLVLRSPRPREPASS